MESSDQLSLEDERWVEFWLEAGRKRTALIASLAGTDLPSILAGFRDRIQRAVTRGEERRADYLAAVRGQLRQLLAGNPDGARYWEAVASNAKADIDDDLVAVEYLLDALSDSIKTKEAT